MKLVTVKLFVQKLQSQRKSGFILVSADRQKQLIWILFFEELNTSLTKACCKYENFVIMRDFNIDVKLRGNDRRKL